MRTYCADLATTAPTFGLSAWIASHFTDLLDFEGSRLRQEIVSPLSNILGIMRSHRDLREQLDFRIRITVGVSASLETFQFEFLAVGLLFG